MEKYRSVVVNELPKCSMCDKDAEYDARTSFGPWGNFCRQHFYEYGCSLGLGKGQKLILRKENDG